MWVGIDDTDSPSGGCTTWVLTELIRRAKGLDVIGYPRLVRLNPNVPFKTRGNAALGVHLGHGRGKAKTIGGFGKEPVASYPSGRSPSAPEVEAFTRVAISTLRESTRLGDPGTDPALVIARHLLPEELYWRAVRDRVSIPEAYDYAASVPGTCAVAYGSGQGIVGACSSLAWRARRRTWEAIAYRPESRWGTERSVDPSSVLAMEARHPETFASWDPRTRRLLVTPHTPCPILFGIRSRDPSTLGQALAEVRSEPYDRWMTFVTNQATGDHLQELPVAEARPGNSPILTGHIAQLPVVGRGGHVRFLLEDPSGSIPCITFEPSKTLPAVARRFRPGDRIRVWGSLDWEAGLPLLRVEGIKVLAVSSEVTKLANPTCPSCTGATSSLGAARGYRCKRCRRKLPLEAARVRKAPRTELLGVHVPTLSARRHLAPPTLIRPLLITGGGRP